MRNRQRRAEGEEYRARRTWWRWILLPTAYCVLPAFVICLAQNGDGWKQALPGYEFAFARDHASHPEYKVEWWYYTGNLDAADGRRFGYQLTFFRVGVDPNPANPSRWAVRDLYMTHLAVTDVNGNRYRYAERLNRAGVGWAGAATGAYRVWNEDWEARLDASNNHHLLHAIEDGMGVDLDLEPLKPPVAHGARGVSQKGSEPGNASHYYSLTRVGTRGTIEIDGAPVEVEGLSWMDHEFGTSFLEPEQAGWDWFSIQLDDGTDLMLFQLRRADGSRDAHSSGTLVDAAGAASPIALGEFDLQPSAPWRSPATGAEYPTVWRVTAPPRGLDLSVRAAVENQELRTDLSTGVTYWEGAIDVAGTRDGKPVRGRGYLEMTGYTGKSMGTVLQ